MMYEHFLKRMISPYMQMLRAAQSDDPDSTLKKWLTQSGPFSWERVLGVHRATIGANDINDWYSDKAVQESLYEEKIKKVSDAYVQWAGNSITKEQRDAMILPILGQAGVNPTFPHGDLPDAPVMHEDNSDVGDLQQRPQYRIWVDEEMLQKTADPQERRDIAEDIAVLRYKLAMDNYKNLPKPIKGIVPKPPVPLPLPPIPGRIPPVPAP